MSPPSTVGGPPSPHGLSAAAAEATDDPEQTSGDHRGRP